MTQINKVYNLPIEQRKELEKMLVTSVPLARISRDFHVSEDSLRNYRDRHLAPRLASRVASSLEIHNQDLLGRMESLMATSEEILQSALEDDHRSLSLKALKEVRLNVETLAKLLVTVNQANTQGLNPSEVEQFKQWKQDKVEGGDYQKLSPQVRKLLFEIALVRLKVQGSNWGAKRGDGSTPSSIEGDLIRMRREAMQLYAGVYRDEVDIEAVEAEVPDPVSSPPPPRKTMRRKKK